jgi:type IV secretory pathway TraG/TraD family ATPase VirD4
MIGIQNVEQIYECYGEQRARSIMSGFLTSVAFRVNDVSSKQYIKDLHGENRKKETYMSAVQARGISENIREAYVVEDWDITNLRIGEAIIGLPGKEPFVFKFKRV